MFSIDKRASLFICSGKEKSFIALAPQSYLEVARQTLVQKYKTFTAVNNGVAY